MCCNRAATSHPRCPTLPTAVTPHWGCGSRSTPAATRRLKPRCARGTRQHSPGNNNLQVCNRVAARWEPSPDRAATAQVTRAATASPAAADSVCGLADCRHLPVCGGDPGEQCCFERIMLCCAPCAVLVAGEARCFPVLRCPQYLALCLKLVAADEERRWYACLLPYSMHASLSSGRLFTHASPHSPVHSLACLTRRSQCRPARGLADAPGNLALVHG